MANIFGDDDGGDAGPVEFTINKGYAYAYDRWRGKEELQKLKDRYGDTIENDEESDSSEESEDEYAEEVTDDVEKGFFKALSALKSDDPKIYSSDVRFYKQRLSTADDTQRRAEKAKVEKPMYLKDYEREFILKREGRFVDDDDEGDEERARREANVGLSYDEEQKRIRDSFKAALADVDDDEEIMHERTKSAAEQQKDEADYREWLKGKVQTPPRGEDVADIKFLHDYWTNPNLDEGEQFLRDYLLNRRYRDEQGNDKGIPTYDEIVGDVSDDEDETILENQEQFERKYNFRFEEPDPEFIKSYPRTVGDSLRRKDDRRKTQREAHRTHKDEEKRKKQEEIKQLKNLKKKEIVEKLEVLQKVTGNTKLPFNVDDLDQDFDPVDYDRKMKSAFDESYYETGVAEDETKPVFSDLSDDEGVDDPADWDEWAAASADTLFEGGSVEDQPSTSGGQQKSAVLKRLSAAVRETGMSKRRRTRRSKLAEALLRKKPTFDPGSTSFERYFDDYYKLDYEDIIGDQPCRFRYRKVLPNEFGLSTNEILSADDKELNSWVSLRRMTQYRSEQEETYDVKAYEKKATDVTKKSRILRSAYTRESADAERDTSPDEATETTSDKPRRKRRKKKASLQSATVVTAAANTSSVPVAAARKKPSSGSMQAVASSAPPSKRVRRKRRADGSTIVTPTALPTSAVAVNTTAKLLDRLSNERLMAYGVANPKKLKAKAKYAEVARSSKKAKANDS